MHATAVSSAHRSGEADQSLCGVEDEGDHEAAGAHL